MDTTFEVTEEGRELEAGIQLMERPIEVRDSAEPPAPGQACTSAR